jgi:ribosomal protein L29
MKISELRQKSDKELSELLKEKRLYVGELGFSLRKKKAKNVKERAAIRKDIARILTILKERQK